MIGALQAECSRLNGELKVASAGLAQTISELDTMHGSVRAVVRRFSGYV